jgi:hypothetical protein
VIYMISPVRIGWQTRIPSTSSREKESILQSCKVVRYTDVWVITRYTESESTAP